MQLTGGTMKNILDPNFKYTNSAATDIRKTFERIKAELAQKSNQREPLVAPQGRSQEEPLVAEQRPSIKTLADFEEVLGAR